MRTRARGVAASPPGCARRIFCCDGITTVLALMATASRQVSSSRRTAWSGATPTSLAKFRTNPRKNVPFGSAAKSLSSSARTCLKPILRRDAISPGDKPAFSRATRSNSPTDAHASLVSPATGSLAATASRGTREGTAGGELSGFIERFSSAVIGPTQRNSVATRVCGASGKRLRNC